jgi:hypothetical protein
MTPKEKAENLIDKMYSISGHQRFSRGYALICIDEIESALTDYGKESMELQNMDSEFRYWDDVRNAVKSF